MPCWWARRWSRTMRRKRPSPNSARPVPPPSPPGPDLPPGPAEPPDSEPIERQGTADLPKPGRSGRSRIGKTGTAMTQSPEKPSSALPDAADAFLAAGGSLRHAPGPYFGSYGGRWMPESLIAALDELEDTFEKAKADPEFTAQVAKLNRNYSGRPSLLTEARRFAQHAGGARVFLKREDLNHTGSHKINNVLGPALLAQRVGKTRLIAETGAGQHGVASATAAALLGMECVVYMGAEDC